MRIANQKLRRRLVGFGCAHELTFDAPPPQAFVPRVIANSISMTSTDSVYGSTTKPDEHYSKVPRNVGHLPIVPIEFDCPACHQTNVSRVACEAVTLPQKIACALNYLLCCNALRCQGRHDINHYCSKCGCYIGRHITLSWYKRALFRMQRSEVEDNNQWQRFRKVEKEQLDDKKLKKQREALAKKANNT